MSMTQRIIVSIAASFLGGLLLTSEAFAQQPPPPADAAHPCRIVEQACEAGGYQRHGKGGKSIRDCMKPLLAGQSVPGVTVDPATLQACTAKRAEWEAKHKQQAPQPQQP